MKTFVALARVSSREQQREGFSLDVQEEALQRYAENQGGQIVQFYKIAETASKRDERKAFKELLAYVKANAAKLDGVLFYKVDRAARNLFDYVEVERLEAECGVPVVYVAQPMENTPAGRMMRRTLANMAAFYTEQQSVDVKEGMARRVQSGLFVGLAPFGYRNIRREGRGLVEVVHEDAETVRLIFELYAYHSHTLDSLARELKQRGRRFSDKKAEFGRSQLYNMLRDRAYLGEVSYRGQWYAGTHALLIDRATWGRVQALLGTKIYHSQDLTYAGGLVKCGHCGRPITGEVIRKQTRDGVKRHTYYRCTQYNAKGHPRVRVKEEDLEKQILALFDRIRIDDEKIRDWFGQVLRAKAKVARKGDTEEAGRINREITRVKLQIDRLLDLRLMSEIDAETFAAKSAEFRQEIDRLKLRLDVCERGHAEYADIAVKAFELSQSLREKWVTADSPAKRRLLEIICLNFSLDGASLVMTIRKPFDVLAEGPSCHSGRGERI
jgi:site-specific DNA recombinase